mmetsp:Transcript_1254/g.1681  ORF Transcript_1254/g.1681 Transcript_1254/m.1681 type:complete len:109 (+) Transcript_1254:410-736(+)
MPSINLKRTAAALYASKFTARNLQGLWLLVKHVIIVSAKPVLLAQRPSQRENAPCAKSEFMIQATSCCINETTCWKRKLHIFLAIVYTAMSKWVVVSYKHMNRNVPTE